MKEERAQKFKKKGFPGSKSDVTPLHGNLHAPFHKHACVCPQPHTAKKGGWGGSGGGV